MLVYPDPAPRYAHGSVRLLRPCMSLCMSNRRSLYLVWPARYAKISSQLHCSLLNGCQPCRQDVTSDVKGIRARYGQDCSKPRQICGSGGRAGWHSTAGPCPLQWGHPWLPATGESCTFLRSASPASGSLCIEVQPGRNIHLFWLNRTQEWILLFITAANMLSALHGQAL